MRFAIVSTGRPLSEIEALVRQHGGTAMRTLPGCGQVFATLEPEQARRLSLLPGLAVREVGEFRAQQVATRSSSLPFVRLRAARRPRPPSPPCSRPSSRWSPLPSPEPASPSPSWTRASGRPTWG